MLNNKTIKQKNFKQFLYNYRKIIINKVFIIWKRNISLKRTLYNNNSYFY